jgi:hypothetical protein
VAHRHQVFDKVVADGSGEVRFVVAVGRAAKESVATWVHAHGGTADPDRLQQASAPGALAGMRFVGVVHPGSAVSGGGSSSAVRADFARAIGQIAGWLDDDPGWLPADPGVERDLRKTFVYRSAPGPFRDFPFGSCPRLGRGATSSNRTDGQRAIQLFSAGGAYAGRGASLDYRFTATGSPEGYDDDAGDLPVEPPRAHPRDYDPGPPAAFARLLAGAQPGLGWPDFAAAGVTSAPSLGTGAVHRGRFSSLSLVVLADPAGVDDVFAGRALCGEAGQRLQRLLEAAGVTSRYLVLRTVPVDVSDLTAARMLSLVGRPEVRALHAAVLDKVAAANPDLGAVLAVGPGAQQLAPQVVPGGLPVVELAAWGTSGAAASWQAGLDRLAGLSYPREVASPSFHFDGARGQIPRIDLPYGTPRWMGTSGDRASRPTDRTTSKPSPDYLKLYLPTWVSKLPAPPLSPAEQAAADQLG